MGPRPALVRAEGRAGRPLPRLDPRLRRREIEETKHALGQVYVDVSRKEAPDDFARDLRKLRRSALCTGCESEHACAGLFELVRADVFGPDDARVRDLLAGLEGAVLDVGCGEAPYADVLAPRIAQGAIRYQGVEPEAARVEALRARLPGATLQVGVAEELALGARFDHALVLRSWNHLRDPERVVRALLEHVRPGGQILVVDNVAFGLLRAPDQAARAHAGRAGFEHHRNDDAERAAAVFARHGLAPVERRDVGPETSNQWLLRYELPGTGSITA